MNIQNPIKKFLASIILITFTSNIAFAGQVLNEQNLEQQSVEQNAIEKNEMEVQQVWQSFQNDLEALSELEIRARLLNAADVLDLQTADDRGASEEAKSKIENLSKQIRELAAAPQAKNILKKILRGAKRAGQTLLFGLTIVGSTLSEVALAPYYAIPGFFYGLRSGKIDLNGDHTQDVMGSNAGSLLIFGMMIIEMLFVPGPFYSWHIMSLIVGSGAYFLGELGCAFPARMTDPYAIRLCKIENQYRGLITGKAAQAASYGGAKIHQAIKFAIQGIRKKGSKKPEAAPVREEELREERRLP